MRSERVRLPDVELSELRYFHAVAQAGSFAEGARRAHVSPPAVSKAIKKLEHALGAELFDRSGRRIELTPTGRNLREHVEQVLRALENLGAAAEESRGQVCGQLRVGTTQEFAAHALPLAVVRLQKAHPALEVQTFLLGPAEVATHLRAGDLDIGLRCGRDRVPDDLRVRSLAYSPTSTVCGVGHPLYDAEEIDDPALQASPYVALRFFGQAETSDPYPPDAPPRRIGATVDLMQTGIQMVTDGGFLGHFPDVMIRCQLNHGELQRVPGAPTGSAEMVAITRPTAAACRATEVFLEHLRAALGESLSRECTV